MLALLSDQKSGASIIFLSVVLTSLLFLYYATALQYTELQIEPIFPVVAHC
jgi:hypothetical protein